jgi:hypothetical protein
MVSEVACHPYRLCLIEVQCDAQQVLLDTVLTTSLPLGAKADRENSVLSSPYLSFYYGSFPLLSAHMAVSLERTLLFFRPTTGCLKVGEQ